MNEPNTLDEQIDKILYKMFNLCSVKVNDNTEEANKEALDKSIYLQDKFVFVAKQQLKALFTEHSKEVDRLARQDQTFKVVQTLVKSGSISDMVASSTLSLLTAQLKRNKGEDNE